MSVADGLALSWCPSPLGPACKCATMQLSMFDAIPRAQIETFGMSCSTGRLPAATAVLSLHGGTDSALPLMSPRSDCHSVDIFLVRQLVTLITSLVCLCPCWACCPVSSAAPTLSASSSSDRLWYYLISTIRPNDNRHFGQILATAQKHTHRNRV